MTREIVMESLHAAFARPGCVKGGLHVEIQLGRNQAAHLFGEVGGKWPKTLNGQPVYLMDEDDHFSVEPLRKTRAKSHT